MLQENLRAVADFGPPSVGQKSSQRTFSIDSVEYPPFDRSSIGGEFGAYADDYDRSLQDPEGFWGQAAKGIHWFESPTKILSQDPEKPHSYQWFSDGTTNTAYNCLDVHVDAGHGDRTALIYDSPVTGVKKHFSYKELLDLVSIFAGALKDELGVEPGDRVVIYMPMIPEAIVAMVRIHEIARKHLLGSV
jgi:propionyl-CoA synthetase